MTSMKTLLLGLSAAALTIGGCAQAQPAQKPGHDPQRTETRAEAQARATEMFARLDVNKDGKLDKADRDLRHQQMREKMFARLDTNGDGSISKAEFMADRGPEGRGPGKMHGKGRGHFGGHRFGAGRLGEDKVMTQSEFVAKALQRFDAQDTNHDGTVTPEERRAARKAHMEERKARWEARKANAGMADKPATN